MGELSGAIADILLGMTDIGDVLSKVWNAMVSNTYILFCVTAGMFGIGIGIFKRLKRAAH